MVLTREYITVPDGKEITYPVPITNVSGHIRELSVTELSIYSAHASVILQSYHLPLKRFLQMTVLNAKVNNWGVECNDYNKVLSLLKV